MIKRQRIGILGSTGSIGRQTLEVVDAFPHRFEVVAIAAHSNTDIVAGQITKYHPKWVAMTDLPAAATLRSMDLGVPILSGNSALQQIVAEAEVDVWVVAVVGTASLQATMAIVQKKIPIALACKEVLVSAGRLIMDAARENAVAIIPIDSEHAALKQCLAGIQEDPAQVSRLILTASGGPFRTRPADTFATITPTDALRHPKWTMGAKISIDSSTLMNKGLEVIEAHYLFNIPFEQISVIIHPQSIIHSMVEFSDGTILSQLGPPDMRYPIQYALTYPQKWGNPWPKTDLPSISGLEFFEPELDKFPMLQLAYDCGKQGGTAPAVMNAANEAAVGLFLENRISYPDIFKIVSHTVTSFSHFEPSSLDQIVALDTDVKHQILTPFASR